MTQQEYILFSRLVDAVEDISSHLKSTKKLQNRVEELEKMIPELTNLRWNFASKQHEVEVLVEQLADARKAGG